MRDGFSSLVRLAVAEEREISKELTEKRSEGLSHPSYYLLPGTWCEFRMGSDNQKVVSVSSAYNASSIQCMDYAFFHSGEN